MQALRMLGNKKRFLVHHLRLWYRKKARSVMALILLLSCSYGFRYYSPRLVLNLCAGQKTVGSKMWLNHSAFLLTPLDHCCDGGSG